MKKIILGILIVSLGLVSFFIYTGHIFGLSKVTMFGSAENRKDLPFQRALTEKACENVTGVCDVEIAYTDDFQSMIKAAPKACLSNADCTSVWIPDHLTRDCGHSYDYTTSVKGATDILAKFQKNQEQYVRLTGSSLPQNSATPGEPQIDLPCDFTGLGVENPVGSACKFFQCRTIVHNVTTGKSYLGL